MQAVGIKLNFRAAGTSTEEVYGPTFADHVNCQLPGFRAPDGFDYYITAALIRRKRPYGFDWIFNIRDLHHIVCAHTFGGSYLRIPLYDRHDVTADRFGDLHEHQ